MTRKSLILALVAAGLVLAATSAAFSLYPQSSAARDTPLAPMPTHSATRTPSPATEAPPGQLGLRLRTLTPDEQIRLKVQGGVLVETVAGVASGAGLKPGDVLLAIDGQPLDTVDQMRVLEHKPKGATLLILRDGARQWVPLELG